MFPLASKAIFAVELVSGTMVLSTFNLAVAAEIQGAVAVDHDHYMSASHFEARVYIVRMARRRERRKGERKTIISPYAAFTFPPSKYPPIPPIFRDSVVQAHQDPYYAHRILLLIQRVAF